MSLLLLFNQPPYHQSLLEAANQFVERQPAVAVVTAHMACEIVVEQLISAAFKSRGIPDLEDAVTACFRSNNLANEQVRDVYVALTGDAIQNAPFWPKFKASSAVRNGAVHSGQRVSPVQGRESCAVARELIAHLQTVAQRLSPTP